MKHKVTVGVCVRNGEDCIVGAINGIIDQDFPHELMEIIFVDDGSEDRTLEIINNYVSKMDISAKVYHQEWKGLGYSRNLVVKKANSKYIIWVDCDMRLPRDFVTRQVEFMDRNLHVGIGKAGYATRNVTSLAAYLENVEGIVKILDNQEGRFSRALGTGGAIYRVEATRQVGGFDESMTGVGEDMDAEHRIRRAGWSLQVTPVKFYEMRRRDWKTLWNEYYWHGSGGSVVYRKIRSPSMLCRMFPPVAILSECFRSGNAYKLVRKRIVFLLPFHWAFKRIAWCLGFIFGQAEVRG